jgi:hypothetical protein
MDKSTSQTDWKRVKEEATARKPILYSPEDGPYDPNDAAAVDAYWDHATIIHKGEGSPARAWASEGSDEAAHHDSPIL